MISIPKLLCAEGKEKIEIYFCYESIGAVKQRIEELSKESGADSETLYDKAKKAAMIKQTLKQLYCDKDIEKETQKDLRRLKIGFM